MGGGNLDKCSKGCGNLTSHRSGICTKCREVVCKVCLHVFSWNKCEKKLCIDCEDKRQTKERLEGEGSWVAI
jgi:hypothetical protein